MDPEVKKIIEEVFPKEEAPIIHKMIEIVERDMSDSSKAKRSNELQNLLHKVIG